MKVFTLYVGTGRPNAKPTLLAILRKYFESFTVISGEGYFRGEAEPMWFVKVSTDEYPRIFAVANSIRIALEQETVGIEYENHYYRCTVEDEASALKAVLGSQASVAS